MDEEKLLVAFLVLAGLAAVSLPAFATKRKIEALNKEVEEAHDRRSRIFVD